MADFNDELLESDESVSSEEESESDEEELAPNTIVPWSPNTFLGPRQISFQQDSKLLVPIPGNNDPIDWFNLMLDDIFLEQVVRHTNTYALELFCGPNTTLNSRITKWKDLTVAELKTFIGLMLHTGTIVLPRLQDYWKTHRLLNIPCFRLYMSRDRFLIILRCLHFSRVPTPDRPEPEDERLFKVQLIIDYFNSKMRSIYYPSKELTIDESMVLWRGRLQFRQYVKGKRHKFGIKIYSLNEPEGLNIRFTIYSGAEGELSGKGHTGKVVMHLMHDFLGKGHSLYMDNFYNSYPLATKLLRNDTYCTGTMLSNRKYLPPNVKSANLKRGESIANYSDGVMIGKWKDKRLVLYVSTEHDNDMVTIENRRRQQKKKPKPIVQYNAYMKGTDRLDQMMSYYPCERKTIRWYKKVFIHSLQMMMCNAFFLYNMKNAQEGRKISLYDFRLKVLEVLLPPIVAPRAITPGRNSIHVPAQNEDLDSKGGRKRKMCRVCNREGKRKQTTYVCSVCPDKPGLCPVNCFETFHRGGE